jgi:hypothetical protein
MRRLAQVLDVPLWGACGLLELLWHFTATYAPRGNIGRFSDAEIAAAVDWRGTPAALVAALLEARWIDTDPAHRLVVHDWTDHMDNGVRERLRRRKDATFSDPEPNLSPPSGGAQLRLSRGSPGTGSGEPVPRVESLREEIPRAAEDSTKTEPPRAAARAAASDVRGTRLPDDFALTDDLVLVARTAGCRDPGAMLEHFRDYWQSQPGRRGVRVGWPRVFRNWARRHLDCPCTPRGRNGRPLPPEPTYDEHLVDRLRAQDRAAAGQHGKGDA